MNTPNLVENLEQALAELPVLDAHTHLVGGKLGARGLHDILDRLNIRRTMSEIARREPGADDARLHFQRFLASRHANHSLCTLARELPNFSLAGYWWHNFFPDVIRPANARNLKRHSGQTA